MAKPESNDPSRWQAPVLAITAARTLCFHFLIVRLDAADIQRKTFPYSRNHGDLRR